MAKSVRRIFTAALGALSALCISAGVCAVATLVNDDFSASAEESVPVVTDENAIVWKFLNRETDGNSFETEYYANANRITHVTAVVGADETELPAEDITVTNSDGEPVDSVTNVGQYKFEYTGEGGYTNTVFTLTINQAVIDLGKFENMAWELVPHNELQNGTIYKYSYKPSDSNELHFYYSATQVDISPNTDWSDWKLVLQNNVNFSIVGYKDGAAERKIHINKDQSIDNNYYVAEYSGDFKATTSGRYEAVAKLTPTPNYKLKYEGGSNTNLTDRGVSISITDGVATVTKIWYIAHYTNAFLDVSSKNTGIEKEVPYSLPEKWTFGEFDATKVRTPLLQHGDEMRADVHPFGYKNPDLDVKQPYGYELRVKDLIVCYYETSGIIRWDGDDQPEQAWRTGGKDTVTFTITRNDEIICENQPRLMWEQYINKYTPVGEYTVTFTAATLTVNAHTHWWNGVAGNDFNGEYSGISNTYSFEIVAGRLEMNDSAFNAALNPDALGYEVKFNDLGKDFNKVFDVISDEISYAENVIMHDEVKKLGRYWANYADMYYDKEPTLGFNLARMFNNTYYAADSAEWANYIKTPDLYKVFYKATLSNYEFFPSVADKENHYFSVTLYEEVEKPSLLDDRLIFSGQSQNVAIESDARYAISENVQTNVGKYNAKLTLNNPAIYRWKDGGDAENPAVTYLPFEIVPAPVRIPAVKSVSYTGEVQRPDIPILTDAFNNPLYAVVDPTAIENGYIDAGTYKIQLKLSYPENYVWVNADGTPAADATDDGRIQVSFVINRRQNSWIKPVSLLNWEWRTFSARVNMINAMCAANAPIDYYVTRDSAGTVKVSGLESFNATDGVVNEKTEKVLTDLPCGEYYLWGSVAPNKNYTELAPSSHKFSVVKALNGWVSKPAIVQWADGASPNLPTAEAKFGEVCFEIVAETGSSGVVYSTKNNINTLATAEAGKYILTAWVDDNANYSGIAKENQSFRIFPSSTGSWIIFPTIDNWTEGEEPSEPVGESAVDGAQVVFTYRTAEGRQLSAKPTTAGDYYLVATAYVDGKEVAGAEYPFKILPKSLLKNEWTVEPSIGNWTEGGKAGEPQGQAKVGEVKFAYKTSDGVLLIGKPVEAGSYVLVVTAEAEGYETLGKEIPFIIAERTGMDTRLIAVIGVLGAAVVVLSVSVAVVTIRNKRKKVAKPDERAAQHTEISDAENDK